MTFYYGTCNKKLKCLTCRKHIEIKQNHCFFIGGWPFCSLKCVAKNDEYISYNKANYRKDLEAYA